MTLRIMATLSCLSCLFAFSRADAKTPLILPTAQSTAITAPTHPLYSLYRVRVADASPPRWAWELQRLPVAKVVGPAAPDEVFQSLDALRLHSWVSHLPAGSGITGSFWLGPIRNKTLMLPAPLQSQMDGFQHFCKSEKVDLTWILGGG